MIWVILLLSVAALGGLIAYAGDTVGRRIGKKHFRLFGLRPKTTGLLIAVLSGVAVALVTVGTVALLARNTLDNAIRAQEIRANLETARGQLGLVNREYASAKRDLEQAKTAQITLEDQLASNRAQLTAKQQELSSAVDLFGRLKTRADELEAQNKSSSVKLAERDAALKAIEAQRRELSAKIVELGQKRDQLQSRIARLTTEKQDFEKRYETSQSRLTATETRLASSQTRVTATQARLDKLEAQVRDFEASRSTLEGDINELIQTKANLEKSNQDLQSQNTQLEKELSDIDQNLKETRTALTLATQGEFIYRRNELIVQAVLPEGSPDQVRSKLNSVVRQASLIAESRGAARGKSLMLLPNNDLEPFVAQAIRNGGPDLVMVRATRNLTRGLQVPVTLELRSNRTLYLASQPIRTLELTLGTAGNAPKASDTLERLQGVLRDVRNDLRTKNVPVENINPPDVIPDEEVAEFADRLGTLSGTVVIGVAGRQDVLPSGPLRFYFFILR